MRVIVLLSLIALVAGAKKHSLPKAKNGGTVIALCDGETSVEVKGPLTHDEAQRVSDQLMAEWQKKHPDARWELAQNTPPTTKIVPPKSSTRPQPPLAQQAGTYDNFTQRDEFVWRESTQKFVDEGDRIFHDAKSLGGTIGVSCDMCHPNAANTHPETYPKYQVQLGRVALLRDMINWCLENPVKARPLSDDDDRMKALEAYIYAQRKGVKLDYGRH